MKQITQNGKLMTRLRILRRFTIFLCCLALAALAQTVPAQESPEKKGAAPAPSQEATEKDFADGVAALEKGNGPQAAALFTKVIEQNPDLVEAYVNRGQAYVL